MDTRLIIALSVVGFLVFFGGLWFGITRLLSVLSGWSVLSRRYTVLPRFDPSISYVRMMIGVVNYNGLRIGFERDGIYLAMIPILSSGHPPLLIPWEDTTPPVMTRQLLQEIVEIRIRSTGTRLRMRRSVFEQLQQAAGISSPPPLPEAS